MGTLDRAVELIRYKCITNGCSQYGFIKSVPKYGLTVAPSLAFRSGPVVCMGCGNEPMELPQ